MYSRSYRRCFGIAFIACCFALQIIADGQNSPNSSSNIVGADETIVRALIDNYFARFSKSDLDGAMILWSAKSPDYAARRQELKDIFNANRQIEIKSLSIKNISFDKTEARACVSVEISAVDAKTGKPATNLGSVNRALGFAREDGAWKIWRETSAERELALQLIAAKTEDERRSLLAANKDLTTIELRKALLKEANELLRRSEYAQSIATSELTERIAAQAQDQDGIATAINIIGVNYREMGQPRKALDYYQKSLEIKEKIGDTYGRAVAYNNIGEVHRSLGEYTQALEFYQKTIALLESIGRKEQLAFPYNNIGIIQRRMGNHALALEYFEKSLKLFEASGNKFGMALVLSNIGVVKNNQDKLSESLEYHRRSLALREVLGNKQGAGVSLNEIGGLLVKQGDYAQALEYFERSLELAEAVGARESIANVLTNIAATVQKQGQNERALQYAERAAALAQEIGERELYWNARWTAGSAHRALNQTEQARRDFDAAIAMIETLRSRVTGGELAQQQFFENKVGVYQDLISLLIAQNKNDEAFAYAEQAKARALLDVLRSGRVDITKAMNANEREREEELKAEMVTLNLQLQREKSNAKSNASHIAVLESQLQRARLDYEAFLANLYVAHPTLKSQRAEVEPVNLAEIATLLDAQTAILEYVVTDNRTYLFVLTKPVEHSSSNRSGSQMPLKLQVSTLEVRAKDLGERAEKFRRELASRSEFSQTARELYELLLKPIQAQLRNKRALIIVPDGALWNLPFQALASAPEHFLLEDAAISYVPSLTALREIKNSRQRKTKINKTPPTLLALGNPELSQSTRARANSLTRGEELEPLLEAEREVEELGKLYGANRSEIFIGRAAREDRVKAEAGKFRVLQFATHGVLNNSNPMYSYIVLAQSDTAKTTEQSKANSSSGEDGLLEAWEMMNLNLNADLVVLSACETARGRIGAGEGVIGMSWALFVAGSPTTVVSQWKVSSASTTDLMVDFHRNLRANATTSKAEAMRQAALKLMRRGGAYRHPFYWAAFVVIGDGS